MTATEFQIICEERAILPAVALENERVREALAARDDEAVVKALDEEF